VLLYRGILTILDSELEFHRGRVVRVIDATEVERLQANPSDSRCAVISRAYNEVRADLFTEFEVQACKLISASSELEY